MNLFGPRLSDGARLEIDGLVVRLTVNRRAKRVSLRIDPARREVVATAPTGRLREAWAFARERHAWAIRQLAALPASASLSIDDEVAIFGSRVRLAPDGRRPQLLESENAGFRRLTGCGLGVVDAALVIRAIKREALAGFRARATTHCAALDVATPPIAIADARTRWGSCTPARPGRPASIRISWRLALAPEDVADYVVAHECAHLVEANHGPRFWAHVRRLVGDEKPHRAWLRAHGASLHGFGN